jgi:hypothetical protein
MRIRARDLVVGDVLALNDWNLHVIGVERDKAVAVLMAEFDFLIHFSSEQIVNVRTPLEAA